MTSKPIFKVAVLPGDLRGEEITAAVIPIFQALHLPINLTMGRIGWQCWQKLGNPLPDDTLSLVKSSDATLIGAITSKPQREALSALSTHIAKEKPTYVSPLITLRQTLDLYASIRPCFSIKESPQPFRFTIIRENTEGLYAGFDYAPVPELIHQLIQVNPKWARLSKEEIACTLRLQSKTALHNIFQFALEYAQMNHYKNVCFADKPNVLRQSSHFARELFEKVASNYTSIKAHIENVDAVAMKLIRKPRQFGIIVAENMYGDILSDVGAAVMGGLGLAPSANIGKQYAYFEPVHGSGPSILPNKANPSAMFLSTAMMLEHLKFFKQAEILRQAVFFVIKENKTVTYDLGGTASTQDMANKIINIAKTLLDNTKNDPRND